MSGSNGVGGTQTEFTFAYIRILFLLPSSKPWANLGIAKKYNPVCSPSESTEILVASIDWYGSLGKPMLWANHLDVASLVNP